MAKEKLEVMVPVEEQPYSIPDNWLWVKGRCWLRKMETRKPTGKVFKYIDIESIDNKRQVVSEAKVVDVAKAPSRASRAVHSGDTVFSTVRPYLKNIAYIDESLADAIASTGFYVCSSKQFVDPKYCYYMMTSAYVVDGLNAFMKGDNSPSIRNEDLENFAYPLPPLPEQQRIVDRIESLFAKLDEAKEKAQAVVDGFDDRKAAILHKAFTGELTAEWRNKNCISTSWEKRPFEKCISVMQNGLSKRRGTCGEPYAVLRLANLSEDGFDTNDLREILLDEKEQKAYALKPDDVLMIRVNGSKDNVGKLFVVEHCLNWAFCDHIIRIRYTEDILSKYMAYYSQTREYKNYVMDNMVSSAGQNTISRKGMAELIIPIPMINEQTEIINSLNRMMVRERSVKEAAEQVISQIDTMKKAILARAFRGELGTNNPSEPPVDIRS